MRLALVPFPPALDIPLLYVQALASSEGMQSRGSHAPVEVGSIKFDIKTLLETLDDDEMTCVDWKVLLGGAEL